MHNFHFPRAIKGNAFTQWFSFLSSQPRLQEKPGEETGVEDSP